MALIAYPFDAQDITEAQYGALIGAGLPSGVVGTPTTNHFKVVAASGMNLTVTAVGGASLALIRGHALTMTANETVIVPAASSSARVDLVVLRMDYANNSIIPAVKQGTSGSSTPPAVTWGASGIYEIPLATVAVAGGAVSISNANITDARSYAGSTVGAWTTSQRPTGRPALGYNLTTGNWEATFNGTAWISLAPANQNLADFGGTLPVSKGGTGATTPAAAQQALNIYTQASAPSHQAGRIWIKLPS